MIETAEKLEVPKEIEDAPEITYASLVERAEVIRSLVMDGTLDGWTGLAFIIWPTEEIEEAQRARWRHDAEQARKRFTPEARERALLLVAGGASYRLAASVALGDERHRMSVWRWARARERAA